MKILKRGLIIFSILIIAGVAFIKFDTAGAAILTDNVLRPLFGANNIVTLEKIYYNTSDKISQLTYNASKASGFQFNDQTFSTESSNLSGTNLDLTPLKVNPKFKSEKKEGVWNNRPLAIYPGKEVMAYTYIRPDPQRAFAYVTIVQVDLKAIHLSAVAGTKQPGGPVGKVGPGVVPQEIIASGNLIAAFDGGFQYRDGEYGMIVGETTYLPLKTNIGTLVGYKDGSLKIFRYDGQYLGNNVEFVRQNCPILIENGTIAVTDQVNKGLWGRTPSFDIKTWRSGVGLNIKGDLVYAVGNNLTPETLAQALSLAGAINAIQLDINPYWVRFNIFDSIGNGKYQTSTLTKLIQDGSKQYLKGYEKDFFYLYKQSK